MSEYENAVRVMDTFPPDNEMTRSANVPVISFLVLKSGSGAQDLLS